MTEYEITHGLSQDAPGPLEPVEVAKVPDSLGTGSKPIARWYAVDKHGAATLCVCEEDARETAAESAKLFPNCAPYTAVQLVPVSAPTSHPIPTGATGEDERAPMPNPSLADLDDPVFEAIWQTIKAWDVNVPAYYVGYCGANGSHVKLILDAVRAASNSSGGDALSETLTILPDGSAFAVASFPLPTGHWLYAEREYEPGAEEPKELPAPILTHEQREAVVAVIRYAVRGATMCGKEPDFDPDALVQNAVYALCGPYTAAIAQQKGEA